MPEYVSMSPEPKHRRTIVWFRAKDLRLTDHVPLQDALSTGDVIPLFVIEPSCFGASSAAHAPHRTQYLLESLVHLSQAIQRLGSRLLLIEGEATEVVPRLVREWKADRVVAHRWVEPRGRARDAKLDRLLDGRLELYEGETLHPPGTLRTQQGKPYSVFSHFARAFRQHHAIASPMPAPQALPKLPRGLGKQMAPPPRLESLGLKRNPSVIRGGEHAAAARLKTFLDQALAGYAQHRDRLDLDGTSRLSADLKFGTLSVRHVWSSVRAKAGSSQAADVYCNELLWREFTHSTLWDRPEVLRQPFRPDFEGFPWRRDEDTFRAWATGTTGYPVVDAAARQLLGEGFVHNRARMIAASFLCKHLLLDYRLGEAHYMKHLVDGDLAQNNAGWQWSAGCGCDAQPYFRVFNPVTGGKRFDHDGAYVRRWVPELRHLPIRYIHSPWTAPASILSEAGVKLGTTYPTPIVDHSIARQRFLDSARAHLSDARAR